MTQQITIRKLDPELKRRLRIRAAEHGRSMEEEARLILAEALIASQGAGGLHRFFSASPIQDIFGKEEIPLCRDAEILNP